MVAFELVGWEPGNDEAFCRHTIAPVLPRIGDWVQVELAGEDGLLHVGIWRVTAVEHRFRQDGYQSEEPFVHCVRADWCAAAQGGE